MDFFDIPINDIEAQFIEFMRLNNCEPEGNFSLQIDGKLHRFTIRGDKRTEKNGAYCVFSEGWPAGWCQNWTKGPAVSWSFSKDGLRDEFKRSISDEQYQAMLERSKANQEKLRKEHEQLQIEASRQAQVLIENSREMGKDDFHPYLSKKQIYPYGLRLENKTHRLIVPLTNVDGEVVNVQFISDDGEKRFMPYGPVSANFFSIALLDMNDTEKEKKQPILLGEGVATMSTIYELTGLPCVAAMNCGNIGKVAEALRGKYSNPIIIMADNDHGKKVNAGKEAAEKANRELKLDGVVMPDFAENEDGTDWNDFYRLHDYNEDFCSNAIRAKFNQLPVFNKRLKYKAMAEKLGTLNAEYFTTFTTPLPGQNSLIEDWIPTETLIMMFAPSGSGKGFVAVDLAYAIATPSINDWHGKKVLKHGPVIYLAGEGQKGLRKRFAGIAKYKNVPVEETQLAIIKEALPINDPNSEIGIDKAIANIGMLYPEPAFIIIDTTNRYMFGDENKTSDATSFIQAATKLMNEFHCTVMVIHHTGLSAETQGRARGSSVFKANVDMEFRISKDEKFIKLDMTKSKDTEKQKPLSFEMLQVPAPGFFSDLGFQETTCVLKYDETVSKSVAETKQKPEKMTDTEKFARDTYRMAAVEFGKILQDPNSARSVVGVDVEKWREVSYRQSASDKEGAKRVQFNRSRQILLEKKNILFKQFVENDGIEYYCLMPLDKEYDTAIMQAVSTRKSKE